MSYWQSFLDYTGISTVLNCIGALWVLYLLYRNKAQKTTIRQQREQIPSSDTEQQRVDTAVVARKEANEYNKIPAVTSVNASVVGGGGSKATKTGPLYKDDGFKRKD